MDVQRLTFPSTLLLIATQNGCGSSGNNGFLGEVGTYDDGGLSFAGGDAGGSDGLDAHIERNHVTVTFVTLSCTGPCADVVAVPTGGRAPYTVKWEDGSTSDSRHVCPTSSTSYGVSVTDTGTTGELARPPDTAQASLTADVIACPDGGSADGGSQGGLCGNNVSFEGTAGLPPAFNAPPWVNCAPPIADGVAISNASLSFSQAGAWQQPWPSPAPTDGQTYLFMAYNEGTGVQAVSEPLCAPMHAATTYALKVDIASPTDPTTGSPAFGSASLKIFGGASMCSEGQLMWTSPPAGPTWSTYCATFTPTEETSNLTLGVSTASSTGFLYVDHIVPVDSCP